jgi:hypothetical protein
MTAKESELVSIKTIALDLLNDKGTPFVIINYYLLSLYFVNNQVFDDF